MTEPSGKQPGNFGFGEDETMLRDTAARFYADKATPDKVHALVASNPDINHPMECLWDKQLWQEMVDLGWTAACVPEEAGGMGMPLVAAVAVAEETGKAACPSPLIATFCATAVLMECNTEAAGKALADIATGTATTLAITDAQGAWESLSTDVTFKDGKLNGTSHFVQDAGKCEQFVVAAISDAKKPDAKKSDAKTGLYLVKAGADMTADMTIVQDGIIDLTRDQAHITFNNAECVELAAPGKGEAVLQAALPALLTLVSADMVGAGEWLLQTTTEYAKTRVQFDRPLGFFQAVKHPLVNVMLDVDKAKSLTYNAACSIDCGEESALLNARMAKAQASDMAVFAASRAVQFHGGIGFTWECHVHLFFKRQMHNHVLYGDARYHRTKLADMVIGSC